MALLYRHFASLEDFLGPQFRNSPEATPALQVRTLLLVGGNSNIFQCSPRSLGKIPILTQIFQMGWFNHQLGPVLVWDLSYSSADLQIASMLFIPQVQRHPNLVPSFQRLDEEQQDLILNNLKAPQKSREKNNGWVWDLATPPFVQHDLGCLDQGIHPNIHLEV